MNFTIKKASYYFTSILLLLVFFLLAFQLLLLIKVIFSKTLSYNNGEYDGSISPDLGEQRVKSQLSPA